MPVKPRDSSPSPKRAGSAAERAPDPEQGPGAALTRRGVARAVTEVAAPANVVAALLVVMAVSTAPPADALRWAVISILFASVLPMAYVIAQVRRRRVTDRHVRIRVQRRLPMLIAIPSTVAWLALLTVFGAPRPLAAPAAARVPGLVGCGVEARWRRSRGVVGEGTGGIEATPLKATTDVVVRDAGTASVRVELDHTGISTRT